MTEAEFRRQTGTGGAGRFAQGETYAPHGTHGEEVTSISGAALLAAAAVTMLFGVLAAWQPASADTLVTNSSQGAADGHHDRPIAQRFRTGGNSGNYAFTGVKIKVAGTGSALSQAYIFVELWSSSETFGDHKRPQNRLLNLSNPSDLRAHRAVNHELTFSAPANTVLARNTDYWVVVNRKVPTGPHIESRDRALQVRRTTAAAAGQEDSASATGWNLTSHYHYLWRLYGDTHGWIQARYPKTMFLTVEGTARSNDSLGPLLQKAELTGGGKWIFSN